jgi:hypothetical protein
VHINSTESSIILREEKNTNSKMQTEPIDIRWANFLLPNKQALYDILLERKFHLPKFESKACTVEYLISYMKGVIFTIKQEQIKVCHMKRKASKAVLIGILRELAKVDLGFDILNPPDKQWLKECIYSLCPEHDIFKNPAIDGITRDLPKGCFSFFVFQNTHFLILDFVSFLLFCLTRCHDVAKCAGFLEKLPVPFKRPKGRGLFKKNRAERKKEERNRALRAADRSERRQKVLEKLLQDQKHKTEKRIAEASQHMEEEAQGRQSRVLKH